MAGSGGERHRQKVDFAQFWERLWLPNGDITIGITFKGDAFEDLFGHEAREAFGIYAHFQVHPIATIEDKNQLKSAVSVLKKRKLDPRKIIEGRDRAGIAKPPPGYKF